MPWVPGANKHQISKIRIDRELDFFLSKCTGQNSAPN
ncbi:unnamed protein product, partial [Rotaria sp. Silwood2]